MRKYKISFGTGTAFLETHIINGDSESDALDKLIDKLEEENRTDCFVSDDDLVENGGDIYDDMYVIGGNHCLLLVHYGSFTIELMED